MDRASAIESTQCQEESNKFYSQQITLNDPQINRIQTQTISKNSLFHDQSHASQSKNFLTQYLRHNKHDSQPTIIQNDSIQEELNNQMLISILDMRNRKVNTFLENYELADIAIPLDIKSEDEDDQLSSDRQFRRSYSHKMIIPLMLNQQSAKDFKTQHLHQGDKIKQDKMSNFKQNLTHTIDNSKLINKQDNQNMVQQKINSKLTLKDIRKVKIDLEKVRELLNTRNSTQKSLTVAQRHCSNIKERVKMQELQISNLLAKRGSSSISSDLQQTLNIEQLEKRNYQTIIDLSRNTTNLLSSKDDEPDNKIENPEQKTLNLLQDKQISREFLFGKELFNKTQFFHDQVCNYLTLNKSRSQTRTPHKRIQSAYGGSRFAVKSMSKKQVILNKEQQNITDNTQSQLQFNNPNEQQIQQIYKISRPQSRLRLALSISRATSALGQRIRSVTGPNNSDKQTKISNQNTFITSQQNTSLNETTKMNTPQIQNEQVIQSKFKKQNENDFINQNETQILQEQNNQIVVRLEKRKKQMLDFANFSSLLKHNIMIQNNTFDDLMKQSSQNILLTTQKRMQKLKNIYAWNKNHIIVKKENPNDKLAEETKDYRSTSPLINDISIKRNFNMFDTDLKEELEKYKNHQNLNKTQSDISPNKTQQVFIPKLDLSKVINKFQQSSQNQQQDQQIQ